MRNVKITPVTSGYQFSTDVYPDTGGTATIIAANVAERQRMSILPHTRQLRSAGGRQWNISGSTIFDVDYQGRSARVKALISPSMEDKIFLGWTTLRGLISGPIYDGKNPTPNATAQRNHVIEPEFPRDHEETPPRLSRTPRHRDTYPLKPCPGCGEDKLLHYREFCPNRNKTCYNCGRLGHIREVCRTTILFQPQPGKTARPKADP